MSEPPAECAKNPDLPSPRRGDLLDPPTNDSGALVQKTFQTLGPETSHFHELLESLDANAWNLARCMWKATRRTTQEPDSRIQYVAIVLAALEGEYKKSKCLRVGPNGTAFDDYYAGFSERHLFANLRARLADFADKMTMDSVRPSLDLHDDCLRNVVNTMGDLAYYSALQRAYRNLYLIGHEGNIPRSFGDDIIEADEILCLLAQAKVLVSAPPQAAPKLEKFDEDMQIHVDSNMKMYFENCGWNPFIQRCMNSAEVDFQIQAASLKEKASQVQEELDANKKATSQVITTTRVLYLKQKKHALRKARAQQKELEMQMREILKDIGSKEDDSSSSEDEDANISDDGEYELA